MEQEKQEEACAKPTVKTAVVETEKAAKAEVMEVLEEVEEVAFRSIGVQECRRMLDKQSFIAQRSSLNAHRSSFNHKKA